MKAVKYVVTLVLIFAFANFGFAQSIVSAKIIPLAYQQQLDTLRIPVVPVKYAALRKTLSYTAISGGDTLSNVIANYDTCGCGTTGLNYDVTFENNIIISIKFTFQTMGAYPDSNSKWYNLNKYNGTFYTIDHEITDEGMQVIANRYKDTLQKRILADKNANKDEDTSIYNELKTAIDTLKWYDGWDKYVFTKTGVLISMDPILPHAVQAFEPNEDLLIPYEQLKKYKKPHTIILQ